MANNKSGNMIYVDTASASFGTNNVRIVGIVIKCTHATNPAILTLGENNSGRSYPTLLDVQFPAASLSVHLDFSSHPLVFASGVRVKTITDATATLIIDNNREGSV